MPVVHAALHATDLKRSSRFGRLKAAGSVMRVRASGLTWIGDDAKQSATDYAEERAKFGRGEIRVRIQTG